MPVNKEKYDQLLSELKGRATLVAVSKTQSAEDILSLYELGHRDFGENYVQELVAKQGSLPNDIRWHFIGHLQSNKIKFIAPFVHLIQGVDSISLLTAIDKHAGKTKRKIGVLLQIHIASEETKFGLNGQELSQVIDEAAKGSFPNINIKGLMGMASFSNDESLIKEEFTTLRTLFEQFRQSEFDILSMGMSSDYMIALAEGSNMVRLGSLIFGARKTSGQ